LSHPPADALWVRVYYEDTDFSGRVYHASYLRFLERGRTEWLRGHGFAHRDLAENLGVVFAVRGASIDFKQRVLRSNKELVTAEVLVASIREGRPARIPADLRRRLQPPS
jgi:acyl-CoA thioester hydrolase